MTRPTVFAGAAVVVSVRRRPVPLAARGPASVVAVASPRDVEPGR